MNPDSTTQVQPLRKRLRIEQTGRMGSEIHPNAFWMTGEYILHLECGHTTTRTSCNFTYKDTSDLFPRRIRCRECDPVTVTRKTKPAKPTPLHDPFAVRLFTEVVRIGSDQEDAAHAWWACCDTSYIADDMHRSRVRVATVLDLARHIATDIHDSNGAVEGLIHAMQAFTESPGLDARQRVIHAKKRVYDRQHHIKPWLSARALIAAASTVSSQDHTAMESIFDAVGWCAQDLPDRYAAAWEARTALDHARMADAHALLSGNATAAGGADEVRARADELQRKVETALDRSASTRPPGLLMQLMGAYLSARAAPPPGERAR